ncbi:MAG: phospholipid-binding protein MlaC [Desulfococcaceae bacterium]
MRKFYWLVMLAASLCLAGAAPAKASEPIEAIRKPIERGLELINDPEYHAPEKQEELREKIWALVKDAFDFEAISMRTLGRNWRVFNDSQRDRFTEAFTDLLKNTYLDNVKGETRGEKVEFQDEEKITDNRAVVRTLLHTEDTQIPIDYSLLLRGGEWRVYDVNVEGVSMVKNYRTQFAEILMNESPDTLIKRVENKNVKNLEDRLDGNSDSDKSSGSAG